MTTLGDFTAEDISGRPVPLSAYGGQVLLVVNTASRCGFTPQYAGLQALHARYAPRGFSVLGFPCNQFGGQEPGTNDTIATFCSVTYGVEFPLFARIEVNGANTHPLFAWLKAAAPGLLGSQAIKWNFTKFLVDRAGQTVRRFAPKTTPASLATGIEALL